MTTILGIDPGPERSAYVLLGRGDNYGEPGVLLAKDHLDNEQLLEDLPLADVCVVEFTKSYAIPVRPEQVGKRAYFPQAVLDTTLFIGRLMEVWRVMTSRKIETLTAVKVRNVVCEGSGKGTPGDAQVLAALCDRWGFKSHHGAKGTAKNPGPLFGVKEHIWDALAVAVASGELRDFEELRAARRKKKTQLTLVTG